MLNCVARKGYLNPHLCLITFSASSIDPEIFDKQIGVQAPSKNISISGKGGDFLYVY